MRLALPLARGSFGVRLAAARLCIYHNRMFDLTPSQVRALVTGTRHRRTRAPVRARRCRAAALASIKLPTQTKIPVSTFFFNLGVFIKE